MLADPRPHFSNYPACIYARLKLKVNEAPAHHQFLFMKEAPAHIQAFEVFDEVRVSSRLWQASGYTFANQFLVGPL